MPLVSLVNKQKGNARTKMREKYTKNSQKCRTTTFLKHIKINLTIIFIMFSPQLGSNIKYKYCEILYKRLQFWQLILQFGTMKIFIANKSHDLGAWMMLIDINVCEHLILKRFFGRFAKFSKIVYAVKI